VCLQGCTQKIDKMNYHTIKAVCCEDHVRVSLVMHLYEIFSEHMVWNGPTSEASWVQGKETSFHNISLLRAQKYEL